MSLLGPISTLRRYPDEVFNADFMAGIAPPEMTFSRSGPARYFGADGTLKTAAANEPRFDYDPITRLLRGLLFEASATNRVIQSEFATGAGGTTGTAVAATGWPGALPQTGLHVASRTTGLHTIYRVTPNLVGVVDTFSVFVRMDDGGPPVFGTTPTTPLVDPSLDFYLVHHSGAIPRPYTVQAVGGGVYRVSGSVAPTSTSTLNSGIVKYPTNSSRGFTFSGYQVEKGAAATSYISTGSAVVTRQADTARFAAPWWDDAIGGSLMVEVEIKSLGILTSYPASLNDGTNNNRMSCVVLGPVGAPQGRISIPGNSIYYAKNAPSIVLTRGSRFCLAVTADVSGDAMGAYTNGGSHSDQTAPTAFPSGLTFLDLNAFGGDTNFYLRFVRFCAKRPDLATLTAR